MASYFDDYASTDHVKDLYLGFHTPPPFTQQLKSSMTIFDSDSFASVLVSKKSKNENKKPPAHVANFQRHMITKGFFLAPKDELLKRWITHVFV